MYRSPCAGSLASIANLIGEWGDGQTAAPRFYFQLPAVVVSCRLPVAGCQLSVGCTPSVILSERSESKDPHTGSDRSSLVIRAQRGVEGPPIVSRNSRESLRWEPPALAGGQEVALEMGFSPGAKARDQTPIYSPA